MKFYIFILYALFIAFLFGVSHTVYKNVLGHLNTKAVILVSGISYFIAVLIFSLYSYNEIKKEIHKITPLYVMCIFLTTSICGFFSHMLYLNLLKEHNSSIVAALLSSAPLFTMVLGYIFLNEIITIYGLIGILFVISGVSFIAYDATYIK